MIGLKKNQIIFLSLICIIFVTPFGISGFLTAKTETESAGKTYLYLDFEADSIGLWEHFLFAKDTLGVEISGPHRYNNSKRCLHLYLKGESQSGEISFLFRSNGLDSIPLRPATRFAWCWKVSKVVDTNGFFFIIYLRNIRTGEVKYIFSASWLKYTHRVLNVYYDPPNTWVYHEEAPYDYVWKRFGPFNPGDFVIIGIGFGVSYGKGVEAWVDNIWLGEGEPPESIRSVIGNKQPSHKLESPLTGFSYGFIDNNWFPDRVDIFRDRVEVFLDPCRERMGQTNDLKVKFVESRPYWKTSLNPQRSSGFASIADLDGDGLSDILLQFDDPAGNLFFKNCYTRRRFVDRTELLGDLRQLHGRPYGSAIADFDCDGDLDVFQFSPFNRVNFSIFEGVRFFSNIGKGTFKDVTERVQIVSQAAFSAAFADVNGDSYLDLFVGYRNFWRGRKLKHDGFLPLMYLSENGTVFKPCPECLSLTRGVFIEGGVFADLDNDGDLDLYLAVSEILDEETMTRSDPVNKLFLNDGNGNFIDFTESSGSGCAYPTQSVLAEDFDLDGDVDLYVVNGSIVQDGVQGCCFMLWNNGDATFVRDSGSEFTLKEPGYGAVAVDFDRDGDMDIAILGQGKSRPIEIENLTDDMRFVEIRLRGVMSNFAGVGAKVYCYEGGYVGDKEHFIGYREVRFSNGFSQFAPPVVHFGTGSARSVDLKVIFPQVEGKSKVVVKKDVPAGSFVEIVESTSKIGEFFYGYPVQSAILEGKKSFNDFPPFLLSIISILLLTISFAYLVSRPLLISKPIRVILFILIATIILATFIRSFFAGAITLAICLLIIFKGSRLVYMLGSIFYSRSMRERVEKSLIDELSRAIHCEEDFSFLSQLSGSRSFDILSDENKKYYKNDFKKLEELCSLMRSCDPEDVKWKQVAHETINLRNILKRAYKGGTLSEGSDSVEVEWQIELKHSFDRLISLLVDYRSKLRRKYSINFIEALNREINSRAKEIETLGIGFEKVLQGEIDGVMVHLTPEEFKYIFDNLFANSIWALEGIDYPKIGVRVNVDKSFVHVLWIDNGRGISEEVAGQLFVSPVTSSRPGGRGEGCFESRKILVRRGGLIRVEKPPEGWSTAFYIKFLRVK